MNKPKYKGGFEPLVAADLEAKGVEIVYEREKLHYHTDHTYTPDFTLPNGVLIEAKGYFNKQDRAKLIRVRSQNQTGPDGFDLDLRLVFQSARNKIYKGSKTTYAMWAEQHGFKWAEGTVPQEWIDE